MGDQSGARQSRKKEEEGGGCSTTGNPHAIWQMLHFIPLFNGDEEGLNSQVMATYNLLTFTQPTSGAHFVAKKHNICVQVEQVCRSSMVVVTALRC